MTGLKDELKAVTKQQRNTFPNKDTIYVQMKKKIISRNVKARVRSIKKIMRGRNNLKWMKPANMIALIKQGKIPKDGIGAFYNI